MATLKSLIYGYESGGVITPSEFYIENTNKWIPHNGGCCYLWTVPSGKTKAVVEMWGGGMGGGFSCCCTQGAGGHSGGYMMFCADIASGDQIRFCSAGTSGANMSCCQGWSGCHSHACNGAGSPRNWCACVDNAQGTIARYPRCQLAINCYSCCSTCFCCGGRAYVGGNGIMCMEADAGQSSVYQSSQHCMQTGYQYMGSAYGTPGPRPQGTSTCCNDCFGGICGSYTSCCGQACINMAYHPGGGGQTGWTNDGTCRCGSPGGGGLIYVVYW